VLGFLGILLTLTAASDFSFHKKVVKFSRYL
jgi:hypothetical protein